jgi:serine/threonine protein kinase
MGLVYLAEHITLGKKAAVKQLLPALSCDAELVERFFNEARSVARIEHPGIVEIFDFGHHSDGTAFIVMELLSGESIAQRLARDARMPIDTALAITRQVASALHAVHERGIVHRDLKPENVYLIEDPRHRQGPHEGARLRNREARPRWRRARIDPTKTGAVFRDAALHGANVQERRADVDRRADIYALGCIVYEMVLGCRRSTTTTGASSSRRRSTRPWLARASSADLGGRRSDHPESAREVGRRSLSDDGRAPDATRRRSISTSVTSRDRRPGRSSGGHLRAG